MFIKSSLSFYSLGVFVVMISKTLSTDLENQNLELTGKLAEHGQFPYAIRLYSMLSGTAVTYCTATIIAHDKLLTAGHCCFRPGARIVVSGDPDHTDFVYRFNSDKYKVHKVEKVVIHPAFERTDNKLVNDLCLLILKERMDLSNGLQTIEVSYDSFKDKKNCTALGWGTNFGYEIQHKLYYKQAIAYRCNLRFGNSPKYWFVCLEPHSVCPGDSGGPLVCDGKLYGIASFFIGHGNESNPRCEEGVVDYYSALSSERSFIDSSSSVKKLGSFSLFLLNILTFLVVFRYFIYL